MSNPDLTRGNHGRLPTGHRHRAGRRRSLLLIAVLPVAGALVLAVATGGGGSAGGSQLGPTVVAEPHDLATTLEASGSLQRSSEHTVAYAEALSSGGGTALRDGSDDTGDAPIEPAYLTAPDTTTSTSTSSTSSTTTPCSPTSSSSTPTSSSSTTSATPCPTTSTTTPITTPTSSSTTPTTRHGPGNSDTPPTADDGSGSGSGSRDAGTRDASPSDGGDLSAPDGTNGDDSGTDVPPATLTSLLDVGVTADRGTVLYTADQQPVVALIGGLPSWRTLEEGVDDGADVQQLEENLVALGHGAGLDVDDTFTADTAVAVEAWETDLHRAVPDGVVTIGDIVFLSAPGDVVGHEAAVGDTLDAGSAVLTIGSEQRSVVANVDAAEAGGWTPGSTVELDWADSTTTEGTVFGVGRDVTDGQVELTIALATRDGGAGDRRSGAAAEVTLVNATRTGVIAVPVAAIVQDDEATTVRLAQSDGPDDLVPVETGLVADGWIEITAGLHGGEQIRLPG